MMQDITAEGHTWTRDFCRWWFNLKLPEHCEIDGDHYILPRYWVGTNCGPCKLTMRRIYLELWSYQKHKVLDIGFLMFDHPELLFRPKLEVSQQVKWMELDKYIESNKVALANTGLYGIEGAIKNYSLPPLSLLIEHVLKHIQVTDLGDGLFDAGWIPLDEHYLDPRTAYVWQQEVLAPELDKFGIKWLVGFPNGAHLESLNKAGNEWLVKHYVKKEHKQTEN